MFPAGRKKFEERPAARRNGCRACRRAGAARVEGRPGCMPKSGCRACRKRVPRPAEKRALCVPWRSACHGGVPACRKNGRRRSGEMLTTVRPPGPRSPAQPTVGVRTRPPAQPNRRHPDPPDHSVSHPGASTAPQAHRTPPHPCPPPAPSARPAPTANQPDPPAHHPAHLRSDEPAHPTATRPAPARPAQPVQPAPPTPPRSPAVIPPPASPVTTRLSVQGRRVVRL